MSFFFIFLEGSGIAESMQRPEEKQWKNRKKCFNLFRKRIDCGTRPEAFPAFR